VGEPIIAHLKYIGAYLRTKPAPGAEVLVHLYGHGTSLCKLKFAELYPKEMRSPNGSGSGPGEPEPQGGEGYADAAGALDPGATGFPDEALQLQLALELRLPGFDRHLGQIELPQHTHHLLSKRL
jgi:hypothetical protein